MGAMVLTGIGLTVAGLLLLGWCVLRVLRARRAGLADAELRALMRRIVAWNMAALGASGLGLMLVAVGLSLGL
jgi:predicted phage tail protein